MEILKWQRDTREEGEGHGGKGESGEKKGKKRWDGRWRGQSSEIQSLII
jgi:hypothetical protein